jgi:hypothetical protein
MSDVSSHRFTAIKLATLATRAATFKQNSHTVATSQVGQQQRSQKQQQSLKRTSAATIPETSKSFANSDEGTTNEENKCTSLRTQSCLNVSGQRQRAVFAYASHRQAAPHTLDATKVISLRYLTVSIRTAHIRHAVYVAFVVASTSSVRVARADKAVAGGYDTCW